MSDLDIVVKAINLILSPRRIILFGSRAKSGDKNDSDIDLAVIQEKKPKFGQRAKVFRKLLDMGYDWKAEPDIHIFSENDFEKRLKNNSFFVREIMKGKTIYAV